MKVHPRIRRSRHHVRLPLSPKDRRPDLLDQNDAGLIRCVLNDDPDRDLCPCLDLVYDRLNLHDVSCSSRYSLHARDDEDDLCLCLGLDRARDLIRDRYLYACLCPYRRHLCHCHCHCFCENPGLFLGLKRTCLRLPRVVSFYRAPDLDLDLCLGHGRVLWMMTMAAAAALLRCHGVAHQSCVCPQSEMKTSGIHASEIDGDGRCDRVDVRVGDLDLDLDLCHESDRRGQAEVEAAEEEYGGML